MISRKYGVLGLVAMGLSLASCGPQGRGSMQPEVVPAGEPEDIPNRPVLARFWGEIDPQAGQWHFYPLHPGNIIFRDEDTGTDLGQLGMRIAAVTYDYADGGLTSTSCTPAGTCRPPVGDINLFTDQTKVTFIDATAGCRSNGGACTGTGGHASAPTTAPCNQTNTFCGPIQLVSNVTFGTPASGTVGSLPDPVIQITQASGSSQIQSCDDDSSGSGGLCSKPPTSAPNNAKKVDNSASNLKSVIGGCSYCYGNPTNAGASRIGLADAVPAASSMTPAVTLDSINTDKWALHLSNNLTFGATFTLRYATASFDAAGSQIALFNGSTSVTCATPGTTQVQIKGGAFGVEHNCLSTSQPPSSCASHGTPTSAYGVTLSGTGAVSTSSLDWSDTLIKFTVPSGYNKCAAVTVTTPTNTLSTTDLLSVCATSGTSDTWRSWTPNGYTAVVSPAGGVIGSNIVIAGGRTSAAAGAGQSLVQILPIPTSCDGSPDFTTGSSSGFTGVSEAAYTVTGGKLYVFGGSTDGSTCATNVQIFDGSTWTAGAAMPTALCGAAAAAIGGSIYVSGGSTQPVPGGTGTVLATETTFIYNISGDNWTSQTSPPLSNVDNRVGGSGTIALNRFNHAAASTGTLAIFAGGDNGTLVPYTTELTSSGFTPLGGTGNINTSVVHFGIADIGGFFWRGGGATTDSASATGSAIFQQISDTAPTSWTSKHNMPRGRWGHVMVGAVSAGNNKVYAIGGMQTSGTTTLATAVDEYTP